MKCDFKKVDVTLSYKYFPDKCFVLKLQKNLHGRKSTEWKTVSSAM